MGRPGAMTGTQKKPKLGPSDAAYPRVLHPRPTTHGTTYPHSGEDKMRDASRENHNLQHTRLPPRTGPPPRGTPAQKRPPPRTTGPELGAASAKCPRRSSPPPDATTRLPPAIRHRFGPPAGGRKVQFQKPADQWNAFGAQKKAIRFRGPPLDARRRQQTGEYETKERRPSPEVGETGGRANAGRKWGAKSAWGDPTLQRGTHTNTTGAASTTTARRRTAEGGRERPARNVRPTKNRPHDGTGTRPRHHPPPPPQETPAPTNRTMAPVHAHATTPPPPQETPAPTTPPNVSPTPGKSPAPPCRLYLFRRRPPSRRFRHRNWPTPLPPSWATRRRRPTHRNSSSIGRSPPPATTGTSSKSITTTSPPPYNPNHSARSLRARSSAPPPPCALPVTPPPLAPLSRPHHAGRHLPPPPPPRNRPPKRRPGHPRLWKSQIGANPRGETDRNA